MRTLLSAVALMLIASHTLAAPKDCEELKEEIEIKIQANNVASYTLEIIASDEVTDTSMVVGSCAAGTQKIIYQRH